MEKEHSERLEDIRFLLEQRRQTSDEEEHYYDLEGVFAFLQKPESSDTPSDAREDSENAPNEADQDIIIEFSSDALVPDPGFSADMPGVQSAEEPAEDAGVTDEHEQLPPLASQAEYSFSTEDAPVGDGEEQQPVPGQASPQTDAPAQPPVQESAAGASLTAAMGILLHQQLSAGIDVGSAFLKYVGLRSTASGVLQLQSALIEELHGIEEVEDSQEKISRKLKHAAACLRGRFKSTDWVVGAVSGLEVIYKRIALPKMSKKELREAVPWAARKDLPFEVEDAALDFQVLGTTREGKIEKIEIATLATPRQVVDDYLVLYHELGVIPAKITGIPVAIRNVICHCKTLLRQRVLVIEVGAKSTHMVFINQGRLEFHREFSTAADDLFEAFCNGTGLMGAQGGWDRRQARELFDELGLPLDTDPDPRWHERKMEDIGANVRTVIDRLTSEVRRSVDYYRDKFKAAGFDAVFLSGGGARVRHLIDHVAAVLDQQVEVLNPFEVAGVKKWQEKAPAVRQAAHFTVALGLALDKSDSLNLLPEEMKGAHRIRKVRKFLRYAAAATVLTLGMVTAYFTLQLNRFSSDLQRLQQEYQRLVPKQKEYMALKKRLETLQAVADGYQSEIFVNTTAKAHLQALSHLVNSNLALTSITIEPVVLSEAAEGEAREEQPPGTERITISGVAFPDQALEGAHLAAFLLNLEQSGYFQKIQIKNRETRADGTIQFVVQCYY